MSLGEGDETENTGGKELGVAGGERVLLQRDSERAEGWLVGKVGLLSF